MTDEEKFCRICYQEVPDDARRLVEHLLEDHATDDEFTDWISDQTVTNKCSSCGSRFESDVRISIQGGLFLRPHCESCRDDDVVSDLFCERIDHRRFIESVASTE